jgi:hypothetical protein
VRWRRTTDDRADVRPRELTHLRGGIMRTKDRIYRHRMTTTSSGSHSIRDDDGSVWIAPARVDKGGLRRGDVLADERPKGWRRTARGAAAPATAATQTDGLKQPRTDPASGPPSVR